jgi:hypothetical protein
MIRKNNVGSLVEDLPGMHKALGSLPSAGGKTEAKQN